MQNLPGATPTHVDIQQTMGQLRPFSVNRCLRDAKGDRVLNFTLWFETIRLDVNLVRDSDRANTALFFGGSIGW